MKIPYFRLFLFFIFLILSLHTLFSNEVVLDNLSNKEREKVINEELLIKIGKDHKEISLLPECEFTEKIKDVLQEVDPNILVETMALLPVNLDKNDNLLQAYNILREVSELTEARYYSNKKGSAHPIFHESYRVASSENLTPLPDDTRSSIPESDSMLIYQDPASLVKVISKVDFFNINEQICVTIENLTDIRFHFLEWVRLVKPHNMSTIVLVLPYGEYSLIYMVGSADAFSVLGLGSSKSEDLIYNRTVGMMNFYIKRLSNIGK